jgi:O-antigen polymerase
MNYCFKSLYAIILFAGSVFITSGKFVNPTNTPKFYFVIATLLGAVAITAIHKKRISFGILSSKAILWGISVICFLQACYGLSQFVGWLPSNHSKFVITGSFDNPAGFAAVLAMGFPIGLFLLSKTKRTVERYLVSTGLVVIVLATFLSGSRTGVLAIPVSTVPILLIETKAIRRFRQVRCYKFLSVVILGLLVIGVFFLYQKKRILQMAGC